jgi:hypothetical protein
VNDFYATLYLNEGKAKVEKSAEFVSQKKAISYKKINIKKIIEDKKAIIINIKIKKYFDEKSI